MTTRRRTVEISLARLRGTIDVAGTSLLGIKRQA
jgi:hypothetical protein